MRDYVITTRDEQLKKLIGLHRAKFGPSFEQIKLKVSQLQSEFNKKYEKYQYRVLMGVSSQYFTDRKSLLYYFETDGRFYQLSEPKAIGSGSSRVYYFLQRYWNHDKTTMKDFARLGDFLIRYVSDVKITLDNAVGLSSEKPYPQIVFIPDDPNFCRPNNNGNPKLDCTPTQPELEQYKNYSEHEVKSLYDQPF